MSKQKLCRELLYGDKANLRQPGRYLPEARCTVRSGVEHSHNDHTPAEAIAAGRAVSYGR